MFKIFQKKNYWKLVGDEEGYIKAVERLGSNYHDLNSKTQGYSESNSIWGQLANFTETLDNTYDTRKWLYTVWKSDRRRVQTKFNAKKANDPNCECITQSSNESMNENVTSFDEVRLCLLIFNIILKGFL